MGKYTPCRGCILNLTHRAGEHAGPVQSKACMGSAKMRMSTNPVLAWLLYGHSYAVHRLRFETHTDGDVLWRLVVLDTLHVRLSSAGTRTAKTLTFRVQRRASRPCVLLHQGPAC